MTVELATLAAAAIGLGPVELIPETFDFDAARPALGSWLGNVELDGDESLAWLQVRSDGAWTIRAVVPAAEAIGDEADEVTVDGHAMAFVLDAGDALRFEGRVSDDGQRLTGTIVGDQEGTFGLARTPLPDDLAEPLSFSGDIDTPSGRSLSVTLVLAETPAGNWVGQMQLGIPGVGILPVYNINEQDGALKARVPLRRGGALDVRWDGPERGRLVGTLQQGPLRFGLDLARGAPAAAHAELPEEAFGNWANSSWMIRRQVAQPWALRGGTAIDVMTGEAMEAVNIVIAGDVIRSISADPVPDGVRVVDIAGRYVVPGLFDLHAHIQPFDRGAAPDSARSMEVLRALLDHGVTMVRGLPLYSEFGIAVAAGVADGSLIGPTVVPAGGIIEMRPQRTSVGFGDPDTARRWVERDAMLGARWIKVYNAMDEPSLAAIVETAHRHGLRVCGHTEDVPPREASQIGMDCIEHMVSIPLSALEPGAVPPRSLGLPERIAWRWANADERRLAELMDLFVANGTAWVPTLVVTERMLQRGSHDQGPAMAAEYVSALQDGLGRSAQLAVSLHRKGGLVGLGTDFPIDGVRPGESVHRELALLVELGGASPLEALRIGTTGSARILGYERIVGKVEAGMVANLVILTDNPLIDIAATQSIALVVHEGREHRPE